MICGIEASRLVIRVPLLHMPEIRSIEYDEAIEFLQSIQFKQKEDNEI